MDHIAVTLKSLLRRSDLERGVSNYSFFSSWEALVGPQLAASTRPLSVDGEVLWVYVDDATLRHHLTFLVPRLLERIRQTAPESRITTIRFTLNPEAKA